MQFVFSPLFLQPVCYYTLIFVTMIDRWRECNSWFFFRNLVCCYLSVKILIVLLVVFFVSSITVGKKYIIHRFISNILKNHSQNNYSIFTSWMSKTSTELGGIGPISCKEKIENVTKLGLKTNRYPSGYTVFENLRKSLIWIFTPKILI